MEAASPGEREWFAVRVKPQHERTVAYALGRLGFERYVPLCRTMRRWAEGFKELDVPIFAGFVFCRMRREEVTAIAAMPAVYNVVGHGPQPVPISEAELQVVKRIESSGLPVSPWPFLRQGQIVEIASGPLSGVKGMLASTMKSWHVVINVELLDRSIAVAVDRADLKAAAAAAGA